MFTHKYEIFILKCTHEVYVAEGMHREMLMQKSSNTPVNK